MQSELALLCLAAAISVYGQTPGDREFRQAQSNIEELRKQVEAGVAPRARLEQAEEALSDAQDAELLSRTLYGKDLTEEQSLEMEAAALRRLERRQAAVEKLQRLVDAGALPLRSLDSAKEEVSWARKEHELVATRAGLVHEIAEMARLEQQALEAQENQDTLPAPGGPVMERFDGEGSFTREDFKRVLLAFEKQFGKPMPVRRKAKRSCTGRWDSITATGWMWPFSPIPRRVCGCGGSWNQAIFPIMRSAIRLREKPPAPTSIWVRPATVSSRRIDTPVSRVLTAYFTAADISCGSCDDRG